MTTDYLQAKSILENLFLEPCTNCENISGPCLNCQDGKVLNDAGYALIEFLGNWLTKFAEVEHNHTIR